MRSIFLMALLMTCITHILQSADRKDKDQWEQYAMVLGEPNQDAFEIKQDTDTIHIYAKNQQGQHKRASLFNSALTGHKPRNFAPVEPPEDVRRQYMGYPIAECHMAEDKAHCFIVYRSLDKFIKQVVSFRKVSIEQQLGQLSLNDPASPRSPRR